MNFETRLGTLVTTLATLLLLSASLAPRAALAAGADGAIDGYQQGRWVLSGSLGVGLASTYGTGGSPLIAVSAEKGVTPNISVGGSAGYATSKYEYYGYSAHYGYTVIAGRGSWHFTKVMPEKPLDLYAGVSLGYNHVGVSETGEFSYGYSAGGSYMLYGFYGGARWYFNPKASVFGELGYGLGELAVGASVRL